MSDCFYQVVSYPGQHKYGRHEFQHTANMEAASRSLDTRAEIGMMVECVFPATTVSRVARSVVSCFVSGQWVFDGN